MRKSNLIKTGLVGISSAFVCVAMLLPTSFINAKADESIFDPDPQTYKFDSAVTYDNGKMAQKVVCTYSDDGSVTSMTSYTFDRDTGEEILDYVCTYVYQNGKLMQESRTDYYRGEVDEAWYHNYTYNDHGDLIKEERGDIVDGVFQDIDHVNDYEYTYDDQNRKTSYILFGGFEKLPLRKEIYTYDANGYFADYYSYSDPDYEYASSSRYDLNDKGLIVHICSYNNIEHENPFFPEDFEYDTNGRLTKRTTYIENGTAISKIHEYSYYEDTLLYTKIARTSYYNNKITEVQKFINDYDRFGRIKTTTFTFESPDDSGSLVIENTGTYEYLYNSDPIIDPVEPDEPKSGLSAGAVIGIIFGALILLLLIIYFVGYFLFYREGKLDEKKIKVIYKFLPRGDKNLKEE